MRLGEERTTAVIVLFLVRLWVLVILARPLTPWKVDLHLPAALVSLAGIGVAAIAIAVLELGWQLIDWSRRRQAEGLGRRKAP